MPPRLARLLAVVAAVGLVGGAVALRSAIAGGDDDPAAVGAGAGPADGRSDGDDGAAWVLLCDADVGEAACTAAEGLPGVARVEVVDAGAVLAGAAGDEGTVGDLWLTLDPMPEVLAVAVDGPVGEGIAGRAVPLASGSLALLRSDATLAACTEATTWSCLAAAPTVPAVAVPSAASSAGTITAAAATAALADAAGADLDLVGSQSAAFEAAVDEVEDLLDESPGTTLEEQADLMFLPGQASGVVTTAGLADVAAGTPQGTRRGLEVDPVTPEVVVGVVLVGLGGVVDDDVARVAASPAGESVAAALAQGGWGQAAGRSSGLPGPELVYAIREELT